MSDTSVVKMVAFTPVITRANYETNKAPSALPTYVNGLTFTNVGSSVGGDLESKADQYDSTDQKVGGFGEMSYGHKQATGEQVIQYNQYQEPPALQPGELRGMRKWLDLDGDGAFTSGVDVLLFEGVVGVGSVKTSTPQRGVIEIRASLTSCGAYTSKIVKA